MLLRSRLMGFQTEPSLREEEFECASTHLRGYPGLLQSTSTDAFFLLLQLAPFA